MRFFIREVVGATEKDTNPFQSGFDPRHGCLQRKNIMRDIKNRAVLNHKGHSFIVWQEKNDNWVFTYGALEAVNTQNKDLQQALNVVHETINESLASAARKEKKKKTKRRAWEKL